MARLTKPKKKKSKAGPPTASAMLSSDKKLVDSPIPTPPSQPQTKGTPGSKRKTTRKSKSSSMKGGGGVGTGSGSTTPETNTMQSLASQIERLESLNISSKLYESSVNSRLREEQEAWERKMADVESKADEVQAVMFRVQDRNYELEKELDTERKTVQALQDQIMHQHDMFLNILAKQKMKHSREQDMLKASEDRRVNGRVLEELQSTIVDNEALSEEVTSLRASMLQMSEVIEHLEYVNLEKTFEIKRLNRVGGSGGSSGPGAKRASPTGRNPVPSPAPPTLINSPALDATDRETKRHKKETMRKHNVKEKNKLEVKSFISSWFSDAEHEVLDQKLTEKVESDAIAEAARRATEEHAAKQRKEQQAKKDLEIKERNDFVQAAKSLKSGPGKMVVALTKCENEIDHLRHKLEMYEEREAESKKLLQAAESTMMSMVKNVEAEALSLVGVDIPPPDPSQAYKPYSKVDQSTVGGTLQELSERNFELERQKRTLLDLLTEYEQDSAGGGTGENFFDFARLSLFSPSTEVRLRNELSQILGLGGEITDDDLLYEIQLLAREREHMMQELDEIKRVPRSTSSSPTHLLEDADVMELVKAKEIQTKNERAREHSIAMSQAKLAAEHPPAPRPPSPLAAMEDEDEVRELQSEKTTHRKHTVGHSSADAAVKEMDRIEKLNEAEKVEHFHTKHGRKHTVSHTGALKAVEKFHESDVDSDSYGSDFDDGSGDGEGGEGDEVEEVDFFTEEKISPVYVTPLSPLAALQEAYVEYPEEISHPNTKLLLHTTKIYADPLGNDYKFVMTCQCLNHENSAGFVMYRIKSYDADVGREMCMDVSEQELRQSMKHDQISFTYDAENKAFQNAVLDRLKLIPGHDVNSDGFLNADDVVREDLTFALVAEGRWKPVKVMIEVGEGGRKKRIREKQKEAEMKREMAKALEEHERRQGAGAGADDEDGAQKSGFFKEKKALSPRKPSAREMLQKADTSMRLLDGGGHAREFADENALVVDKSGRSSFVSKRSEEVQQLEPDGY
ncbi:hypothetical protein TrST_g13925 [Triparma strigata]|uniref:Uncharacterized protein n=1 Tax=Triparma strigata TaxID=1606541 RepID=A0A9W7BDP1_9STRA|nr:hypothetical protein TrST_g13925 [Triparma strigata]